MQVSGWIAPSTWITIEVIAFLVIPDKDRGLENKENNLLKGQGDEWMGKKLKEKEESGGEIFVCLCFYLLLEVKIVAV